MASTLQRAQAVLVIETFSSVLAGLPQAHYGITGGKKKKEKSLFHSIATKCCVLQQKTHQNLKAISNKTWTQYDISESHLTALLNLKARRNIYATLG